MKKFQIIGVLPILIYSFFYTEKIANLTLEKNEIYQSIKDNYEDYNVNYVNAEIIDNKVIPGLNGKTVNIKSSYFNMKDMDAFNEYYLKYDTTYPKVSLSNNKDKIIVSGNKLKNAVSFVLEYDEKIIKYFNENNIDASVLVDLNTFKKDEKLEQINNEVDKFKTLDSLLHKYNNNNNICYASSNNEKICLENKKYLVKSEKVINNSTFINIKNNINRGDIYYVSKNINVSNLNLIIKSILYKDLDIIRLSKMISEERDWFKIGFLV